jgi:adenylyltransferase/sulfurtransferase
MTMLILPHQSFCLRCFMSDGPLYTCQSIGVLSTAVDVIGSFAVTEAMKWLLGCHEHPLNRLISVDVWHSDLRRIEMRKSEQICPVCEGGRYDLLGSSPQPA